MPEWTSVADHLPGLTRQGFNPLAPADFVRAEEALRAAGFVVRQAPGTGDRDETMRAICTALNVTPVDNLDAFADVLRDVTAESGWVVLIWIGADQLLKRNLTGWVDVVEILTRASLAHWSGPEEDRIVFETLAVMDGFGVEPVL